MNDAEERAAIKEYSGRIPREEAERQAIEESGPCACGCVEFYAVGPEIKCARCFPPFYKVKIYRARVK